MHKKSWLCLEHAWSSNLISMSSDIPQHARCVSPLLTAEVAKLTQFLAHEEQKEAASASFNESKLPKRFKRLMLFHLGWNKQKGMCETGQHGKAVDNMVKQ